ncbi:MAG TPA: protein kinase, partial [Bdellovibrionota bacterium]|nr:protein kinase [Bdellovibrionota bacterium]
MSFKTTVYGKYFLLDRIAVGGMAEVFKAKTFGVRGFERLLVIKRILPHLSKDDEFVEMFIDEAKISVGLTHANICQVTDLGKIGDNYFIAMEYIDGKDLRAILKKCHQKELRLGIPQALFVGIEML